MRPVKGVEMATVPDSHRDLLDAPVATLATVGADGRPQLSAVWFLADGDNVRLSLNTSRQKTKNLSANSAATLFILDPANPMRYLEVRGDVSLAPDDDYAFADKVGAKYGGIDLRNMDQPGEKRVVVTIDPVRINAVDLTH
jgi:PPOX class probable F420-dependent enzyme